jgi:hypothetical protein
MATGNAGFVAVGSAAMGGEDAGTTTTWDEGCCAITVVTIGAVLGAA